MNETQPVIVIELCYEFNVLFT